jgi:hypothetical protein
MDTAMCEIINAFYVGNDMDHMLIDNDYLHLIQFGLLLIEFLEQSC